MGVELESGFPSKLIIEMLNKPVTKNFLMKFLDHAPRTVVMQKGFAGYGFIVRGAKSQANNFLTYELNEQFPALQHIERVDADSSAAKAGLKAGDFLLEINGVDVVEASHEYVSSLIKQSEQVLAIKVITPRKQDRILKPVGFRNSDTLASRDTTSIGNSSYYQQQSSLDISSDLFDTSSTRRRSKYKAPRAPERGSPARGDSERGSVSSGGGGKSEDSEELRVKSIRKQHMTEETSKIFKDDSSDASSTVTVEAMVHRQATKLPPKEHIVVPTQSSCEEPDPVYDQVPTRKTAGTATIKVNDSIHLHHRPAEQPPPPANDFASSIPPPPAYSDQTVPNGNVSNGISAAELKAQAAILRQPDTTSNTSPSRQSHESELQRAVLKRKEQIERGLLQSDAAKPEQKTSIYKRTAPRTPEKTPPQHNPVAMVTVGKPPIAGSAGATIYKSKANSSGHSTVSSNYKDMAEVLRKEYLQNSSEVK